MIRASALALLISAVLLGLQADQVRPDDKTVKAPADTTVHAAPPDSVVACYFHRTFRCDRCLLMEACARDVIEHDFSAALNDSTLRWRTLDFERPEQAKNVEKYQLDGPALVLSHWSGGAEVSWVRVDELWDVIDDPEAVSERVRERLHECLEGRCLHHGLLTPGAANVSERDSSTLRSDER